MASFRPVPAKIDFPAQEREILRWWGERDILTKYLRRNETSARRFAFLDGPITANNPMGIHHAWGRTYKDLFQRYKTMAGYRQRYQNGFDGQGLWVEVEVEKELGFKSKRDIERYGIAPFVELCKARVRRFAEVITQQSLRLGYWMRWDDSYHTMADENNYMIWHFLKRCWERGLIYKGHDAMPWCPRCGTGISEHEIVTEGYREVTHPGLVVRLPLLDAPGRSLLVWTTTPWTLTSNVAAAVHPGQTYVRVRQGDEELYVMEARLGMLTGRYAVVETLPGHALVGWRYRGPFDDLPAQQGVEHRVIPWEEVSAEEGTGIVHIAPGAGAEDFALGRRFHLAVLAPLDESGVFVEGFGEFTGREAAGVAGLVEDRLRQRGLLYRAEPYTHRYPVCWRCGTELVFRVVDEWFIAMDPIRAEVMEAARQVRWIPEFGLERELDWLRNMHDWMISKKRYWGLALPIYECPQCRTFEVLGSREELRARAVEGWEAFEGHSPHRPWVDAVKIRCRGCGAAVGRIPDVGNPWLDAGIVPFSTLIDPATGKVSYLDDRRYWREWFPFDFITEAFPGQYRNWFYSLLVMSTVLERQAPFRVCLGHALVRDEQGREMHKSWGNAIEFEEAADRIGSDVVRWVFAAQNPAVHTNFGYGPAADVRRRFVLPWWNVYAFFVTYASLERDLDLAGLLAAPPPLRVLDRWILSRLAHLVQTIASRLDDYEPAGACRAAEAFVDDLSTWYVRRSRRRFWKSEDDQDKRAAYYTLYTVLKTLAQALAPFVPFLTEAIYQNLVRTVEPQAPESVHLCDYPALPAAWRQPALEALMDDVRELVRLGRAARGAARIRVRQPLPAVLIATTRRAILQEPELVELLADELNVKRVRVLEDVAPYVTYEVKPRFDRLGPRFGARVQAVAGALRALAPAAAAAVQRGEAVAVTVDGERVELSPEDLEVRLCTAAGYTAAGTGTHLVVLETAVDDALAREGWARELVHHIQQLRKDQGLEVSDRIVLYVDGGPEVEAVVQAHREYVLGETLAVEVRSGAAQQPGAREIRLDHLVATVAVGRP